MKYLNQTALLGQTLEAEAKTEIAQWSEGFEQALPVGTEMLGDQFTITGHLGAGGFGNAV